MNDFVEECRHEWRRLRVPDPVANEMAAELAADLDEAQAEGVSPEEVLGRGASDPRSFAAAWAAERGVGRSSSSERVPKRALIAAPIAALAAVAVSGAVLIIVASTSSSDAQQALAPPAAQAAKVVWVSSRSGNTFTIAPPPFAAEQDAGDSSADTRTIGLVLLIVGLAGLVPMTAWWLLAGGARWSRRGLPPTGRTF